MPGVHLLYAIGNAQPTARREIDATFGTARVDEDVIRLAVLDVFDLRPSRHHVRAAPPHAPVYADTAAYGHFNGYKFSWENLDKTEELRKAVEKYAD
ncbi:MAG: methionine adenosyltransferase domain-containing protein [Dysosmobacter sp.]